MCMVSSSTSWSTPGWSSITVRMACWPAGSAARPISSSLLSRPSRIAMATSRAPIAIDAAPS